MKLIALLVRIASNVLLTLVGLLVRLVSPPSGPPPPKLTLVRPLSGWPGTIITLRGSGFSESLDGNVVDIGGDAALVLRAASAELMVLVGEKAASGPIRVTVAGVTTTAAQDFGIRPQPDARDSASAGPPIFYHGPQRGTPAVGRQNQRVLAIFASAAFEPPINMATEIGHEMTTFAEAERFWREATYERPGPSPHGTSFKIDAGPAINLPRRRNEYVWDEGDTAFARWQYLTLAKRWTHIVGNRAFCAHQAGGLAVADLAGPNWPAEVARLAPGWLALHVVVQGNTAFIAAGADGLIVADIAGPTPVQLAKVTLGGKLRACDVSGNTLVAAARDSGLEVYDVSNRSSPVRRAVFDGGAEWASAIRLQGTRAYMGSGDKLRIYDVSNLNIPVRLGEASAGDWILALDIVGSTCVVGTDGNGLAIFDVSGPVPLPRGSLKKDALRVQGVRLVGTRAYVSCGAQGLMIVDVSDPSNPVQLALLPTGDSCYDVAVSGSFAVVALGGNGVAPGEMIDPKKPVLGFRNYLTSTPPLGGDYDLAALQTNLKNADDSNGKLKGRDLYEHALLGAKAAQPSLNLNDFEGFIIVIRGFPGRGTSTLSNKLALHNVGLNGDKGMIWLPSHTANGVRTTWGRKAHEIGHWLGMDDIYQEKFEDGTILEGTAGVWDMAGEHDEGPLFSGREAVRMKLFKGENVEQRTWNPAGGPGSEIFEIVAHGATEDSSLTARVHLVELIVAPGALSYFIEVRQRPGTVIFDPLIPVPAGAPGVVLVTRVSENASLSNTFERPVQVFGVLAAGQSVVDALRLLRIEAQVVINANPLTYRVVVHWNEEPPENPDGLFDLRITPWNTERWETPDIWINSKLNDGATMIFSSFEGTDNTKPALNGDKPWEHHDNTIFARVTNSGVQTVSNVLVSAYTASPPGIGDNGSWQTLKTVTIPTIAANSAAIAQFTWRPREKAHTCVQVAIYPQPGEIQPRNNRAQENFFEFDSAGSSSHEPVILEAEVRSPFTVWRRVDVVVQGLPDGWHAVVDKEWVWVEPKGAVPVTAVIWTDLNSPRADGHIRIPDEAFARVEGWTDFHKNRYLPIGGILAKVRANKRTRIVFEATPEPGLIRVRGGLKPPAKDVRGVVEITNAAGVAQLTPFISDTQGNFETTTAAPPGGYDVQIFSSSTRRAAEAASVVRHVQVPS